MAALPVYGLLELFIDSEEEEGGPFFVLQRKGSDHPNPEFRNLLTLFGGSQSGITDAKVALEHRLGEQFDQTRARLLIQSARLRVTKDYITGTISFFECRLQGGTLKEWLARLTPNEGHVLILRAYEVQQLALFPILFLPNIAARLCEIL